jgi:hypothetical protein
MDWTVAVQTKGFGSSFQAFRKSVMALCKSSTPKNEPRRTRLEVSSPNQRSIRFSQLELVGTSVEAKKAGVKKADLKSAIARVRRRAK